MCQRTTNQYFKISDIFRNSKKLDFMNEIKWWCVFSIVGYHVLGVYWCFHYAFPVKWQTVIFAVVMFLISGTGITCGVHRLWTHRSYKVTQGLKIYLMLSFAASGQLGAGRCSRDLGLSRTLVKRRTKLIATQFYTFANSIYNWVRDHRLHHKYSDTEADPHNSKRGLVFSHIGWLMVKKNELVIAKGREVNMSDIEADPLLMWERRHSTKLSLIFCYLLPTITGVILWSETVKCAIAWQCFIRVLAVLHGEMTVNSLAHAFGSKPYNTNIIPRNNIAVTAFTLGEGSHNYHHVFPYDYKAAETFDLLHLSTFLIRLYKRLGLAYDLKEPSREIIEATVERLSTK